jgi:hypothetical protein
MESWDDDYEDELECLEEVECVCGCDEFYFMGPNDKPVTFTIDQFGSPLDTFGLPVCASCGIDYPIVITDMVTGEMTVLTSDDVIDPDA